MRASEATQVANLSKQIRTLRAFGYSKENILKELLWLAQSYKLSKAQVISLVEVSFS